VQAKWLEGVSSGAVTLSDAPDEIRGNREVVSAAVRFAGCNLHFASKEFLADKKLALMAIASAGGSILSILSEDLRADREVVLRAVLHRSPGDALDWASYELRNDKDLVLAAVRENPFLIVQAPLHLQNDQDVVLAVIAHLGFPIDDCPREYESYPEGYPLPVQFLSDKNFIFEAVCLGRYEVLYKAMCDHSDVASDEGFMMKLLPYIVQAMGEDVFTTVWSNPYCLLNRKMKSLVKAMSDNDTTFWEVHSRKPRIGEARVTSALRDKSRCARAYEKSERKKRGKGLHKRGGRHKVKGTEDWEL
jgi:hypothetical protein